MGVGKLRDGPVLAGDFDGGVVVEAEVDLIGFGGDFGGAGVDDFLSAGRVGLVVEIADNLADLLRAWDGAELLFDGGDEPAVECFRVEGDGGGGGGADDEGLAVWGEEERGAVGDFEKADVLRDFRLLFV